MYPTQLHSYLLWRSGTEPGPQDLASRRYTAAVSLIPATMCGIFVYGWYASLVALVSLAGALIANLLCKRLIYRREAAFFLKRDGVWMLTGLLVGLMLPPAMPLWLAFLGSFIGVFVGKWFLQVDGTPLLQPALLGLLALHLLCPLLISLNLTTANAQMNPRGHWPVLERASSMETSAEGRWVWKFVSNFFGGDIRNAVDRQKYRDDLLSNKAINAEATYGPRPMELVAAAPDRDLSSKERAAPDEPYDWLKLLIGYLPGVIGGSSGLGLLAGILLLVFSRAVSPILPLSALGTLFVGLYFIAWMGGGATGASVVNGNIPVHLLSGSTLLAVFYFAADPGISPRSPAGKFCAGVIFALLELLFRVAFKWPDGLLISLLAVQSCSFVIDQWIAPPGVKAPSSVQFGLSPSSLGRL